MNANTDDFDSNADTKTKRLIVCAVILQYDQTLTTKSCLDRSAYCMTARAIQKYTPHENNTGTVIISIHLNE